MKPVVETEYRDASYDRVRNVTETINQEQRYMVARPVIETQEREERYMVRRPIYETAEREESTTVMEPVVSLQTQYIDQGQYVDQQVCRPSPVRYSLGWQPAACAVDPLTRASVSQPGGWSGSRVVRSRSPRQFAVGSRMSSPSRFRKRTTLPKW